MRLLEIELTNFRSYEHETIQFTDGRTLVIGENGTGKSTLVDAIAWGLTGKCRGVDGRGQGQKELIRLGADQATVRVKTDTITVVRQITRNGGASSSMKTESVLAHLDVSEAMLLAVLYGRHFFTLHHADAKAMLMQLLGVAIPLDQLPASVAKNYSGPLTLADAQAAYDAAFKDRAAAKKALGAITVPDVAARPDLDGWKTSDLQVAIQAARQAYQKAVADLAQAEAKRDAADQALMKAKQAAGNQDRLKGNLEAHQGMLREAQAALDVAKADLAKVEATTAEPVDSLQAEVRAKRAAIGSVESQLAGDDPAQQRLCVLGQGIPCLTPGKEFKAVVKQLKADVKALDQRVTAGLHRAQELAGATTQARTLERQLSYHQDQVAKAAAQVDEAAALAVQLASLESQAVQANHAVPVFREPVTKAQADTDRLVKQQAELAAYQAQLNGRDRAQADLAKLQQQVAVADALVDLLGPKGLPAKVLGRAVGDFEAMINAALKPFGFSLSFLVDPWNVAVRTADQGQPIPFDLLSAGEQLWTGLAFQLALAALSGLNCCCLDAAETVVGVRRSVLTGLIMNAPVDQVIVAMAKAAGEAAPEIPGLQVIRRQAAEQPA